MADATHPSPPKTRRRLRRALWWFLGLVLIAVAVLATSIAVLLSIERAQHWQLSKVPGITIEVPQGLLTRGPFRANRLVVQAGNRQITLHDVKWNDLRWQWRPYPGAWLGVTIDAPRIGRVEVGAATTPAATGVQPPASLRTNVAIHIKDAHIGELLIAGTVPLKQLRLTMALGEKLGAVHRIESASAQTDRASVALSGTVATDAPFALDAQAQIASTDETASPWQGQVQLKGPLETIDATVKLTSSRTGQARVDGTVQLTPFAAWPLGDLRMQVDQLNLASLDGTLPQTLLSGQASVTTTARDSPIHARITLTNAKPGRWDAHALPVERLTLQAEGLVSDRNRLQLPQFEAVMHQGAGTVRGSGQWQGHQVDLTLQIDGLRPAALDARAAKLAASGRTTLTINGLPTPMGQWPIAPTLDVKAALDLQGQLDGAARQPVRLQTQAHLVRVPSKAGAPGWEIDLNDMQLRSGPASAVGDLHAELVEASGRSRWSLQSKGTVAKFDPSAWWKGNSALPSAVLNGRWSADLRRGDNGTQGAAELTLTDSRVGDVPTSGTVSMKSQGNGWLIDGTLQAASNMVRSQGLVSADGQQDRWTTQIEARALAALAPLARLLPPSVMPAAARDHLPTAGALSGRVELQGRWPQARTSGDLTLQDFQSARSKVKFAQAQWQAGPDARAPLLVNLQSQGLVVGEAKAQTLTLRAEGTLAAHQLKISTDTPLKPPALLKTLVPGVAVADASDSRIVVSSDARFDAGTHRWQGTIEVNAATLAALQTPWFAAQDMTLAAQFTPQGRLVAIQASGGKSQLGGAQGAQLLWREARWTPDQGATRGELKVDVELQPLAATPILSRLYPQAGFGGNLAIKGRATIQASEKFAADVVIEREGGDLFVRDEDQTQSLGLSDLRMGYVANEGTWHFTQAVAGANLGVLVGATSMRVPATARWPAPTAPMEGVLEWQVADMGIWARFMPPGWRLGGKLRTSAAIGGQFGAPEVRGQMQGQGLAIRNLLQGVDVHGGELAITLAGAQAKVDRFVFKGGDGELRLTGGAVLGATPSANLTVTADKFRLLGRIDRRIVATGRTELALTADKLALNGKLTVDEGLIDLARGDAPSLDNDVTVRRRGVADAKSKTTPAESSEAALAAPTARRPSGAPRDVSVALAVDLGNDLKLRGRGLDTRLAGQLNITAPGGRMAVSGTVRAVDGTYAAYGQKLDIERGIVTFTGTVENPRLDIFAVRPNLDVRVGVQVAGTAQVPRVRLTSEPEMSEFEKLSWLVLGRAGDGLGRPDTALLQRAALALLSGPDADSGGSPLSALGLDDFSVRQTSDGDVRNTVVSLGKQLSRRWYVGYEQGVNSTTGTWQLIYRVAQRFTLRAQSGEENSLDAIWTWRWN